MTNDEAQSDAAVEGHSMEADAETAEGDQTDIAAEAPVDLETEQALLDSKALLERLNASSAALSDDVKMAASSKGELIDAPVNDENIVFEPTGKTLPQTGVLLAEQFRSANPEASDAIDPKILIDGEVAELSEADLQQLITLIQKSPELAASLSSEQLEALKAATQSPEMLSDEQKTVLATLSSELKIADNVVSTQVAKSEQVDNKALSMSDKPTLDTSTKVTSTDAKLASLEMMKHIASQQVTDAGKPLQDTSLKQFSQPTQIVADQAVQVSTQAKPELSQAVLAASGFSQSELQKAVKEGISPELAKLQLNAQADGKMAQAEAKPEVLAQQLAASFGQQGSTIAAKLDTSVAQSPLQLSTNQNEAAAALAERVNIMMSKNLRQVDIRLDPPELGRVQIKLSMGSDQQASVQFTVSSQHARDALESTMPRLREMMQQQGLQLSQSSVQQQDSGNRQAFSGDGQQGDNKGSSDSGHNGVKLEEDANTLVRDLYIRPASDGVDYYA
ncbi:hypothetical protein CS022_12605 [Veronia nyctiphanis]|uniref:Flagellar hook-length control protein-like C-terminal domain-containing protein n=1 Tax=Veronia nyctiphanis TaxID=1278244 RepID=A0A4Q0YVD3_9GAMM|nr:flagellar hook-length control protein FliK [Veronia nyctiphanis]RXJ72921.1 hypothetical protein CS022_12605 [Veronia nyctiphanis]